MITSSSNILVIAILTYIARTEAQQENVGNRTRLAKTAIDFGIKIFKQNQIVELMKCVDPLIYNLQPYDKIKEKGKSCSLDSCNKDTMGCYAVLLNANNKIDACLKRSGSNNTAMDMADKALVVAGSTLKDLLQKVQKKVETQKKNKVAKKNVYENAYKQAGNIATVSLVDSIGMKVIKTWNPKEYACIFENIGPIVNIKAKNYKFANQH